MAARVKCVAVRGCTVVAGGSDGDVRVTELAAAVSGGGSSKGVQLQLVAEATTGARITSCAIAALQ